MASVAAATRHTYVDRESLNHALTSDLVGWTVSETREAPLLTHVAPHHLGDIRLLEVSGNPLGAVRGRAETGDSDTYLGILYQRSGSTLCRIDDDRVIVGPGEISVWHSERLVSFEMPEIFDKLCMIVPPSNSPEQGTSSTPRCVVTISRGTQWSGRSRNPHL